MEDKTFVCKKNYQSLKKATGMRRNRGWAFKYPLDNKLFTPKSYVCNPNSWLISAQDQRQTQFFMNDRTLQKKKNNIQHISKYEDMNDWFTAPRLTTCVKCYIFPSVATSCQPDDVESERWFMLDCIALLPRPQSLVTSLYLGIASLLICSFFSFSTTTVPHMFFTWSQFSIRWKFKVVRDPDLYMHIESELPFQRDGKTWVWEENAVPLNDLKETKQALNVRKWCDQKKLISRLLVSQRQVSYVASSISIWSVI